MEGNGLCFLRWKLILGKRRKRERKCCVTPQKRPREERLWTRRRWMAQNRSNPSICQFRWGIVRIVWVLLKHESCCITKSNYIPCYYIVFFFVHLLRAIELSRRCATSARSKPTKISPNCRSENSNFDINEFDYTLQIASNLKFYIWKKKANLETIMKLSHARSLQMRLKWPEKNV